MLSNVMQPRSKQLAESGEIEVLDDVWDKYASDFTKEIYAGEGFSFKFSKI